MANDGAGNNWDESNPANSDFIKPGAQEIRDVRIGNRRRIEKEHVKPADGMVGGEHLNGSAKAYIYHTNAKPSKRPDQTPLTLEDSGRLGVDKDRNVLQFWDFGAGGWQDIKPPEIDQALPYMVVKEQKSVDSTDGGTLTSGSWQQRTMNLVAEDSQGLGSLIAGRVRLAAGTYRFSAYASAQQVNSHKVRLYNHTNANAIAYGSTEYAPFGTVVMTKSLVVAEYRSTIEFDLELQHLCGQTKAGSGKGLGFVGLGFGGEEFARIEIWKLNP